LVVRALKVRWSEPAERDLDALLAYIALDNPKAAGTLLAKILEAIESAAGFPELARLIPDLGRPYRELLSVRPFRVIYRIAGKDLWVIGVMRAEQLFTPEAYLGL
jgi:plasmid stabilization system protein ParE